MSDATWWAIVVLTLPFLASALAAIAAAAYRFGVHHPSDLTPAGPWLERQLHRLGLPARAGVSPELAGSMDGYWPEPRFIGLSPATWAGESAMDRAVAAHELGHAITCASSATLERYLAWARGALPWALNIFGAAVVTSILYPGDLHIIVVPLTLGIAVLVQGVVVLDEALASSQALQVLQSDVQWGPGHRKTAIVAMGSAWLVYAASWMVRAALLTTAPLWVGELTTGARSTASHDSAIALWLIVGLTPLLLLYLVKVCADIASPSPVSTEFRLAWVGHRDRSWSFQTSLIIAVWVGLCFDRPSGAGLAEWVFLAMIPAMQPLSELVRALAALPLLSAILLVQHWVGPRPKRTRPRAPRAVAATDLVGSHRALGWRLLHGVHLLWVPLATVLLVRVVHGFALSW